MFIREAKPVFLKGLNREHNVFACFKKEINIEGCIEEAVIQITARSFYRLYINERLVMHGPARTAHGYLRVDELDISSYLKEGVNSFTVFVLSYSDCFNGYSNEVTLEPGMIALAVKINKKTALVSDKSWNGYKMINKMHSGRLSHCRSESEIYIVNDKEYEEHEVEELSEDAVYLERRMLYPELNRISDANLVEFGSYYYVRDKYAEPWFFEAQYKMEYDKVTERPDYDAKRFVGKPLKGHVNYSGKNEYEICTDNEDPYVLLDFGKSHVGFIAVELEIEGYEGEAVCDIHHSESFMISGEIGIETAASIRLHIQKNKVSFISMEPYLLRYLKLCFKGVKKVIIKKAEIVTYYYPDLHQGAFCCSDEDINRLYNAARHTLLLNTLDIFMDCPERERGGWLCDSLWTARGADLMLGDTRVEKAFIENFLMTKTENMWKGFFPEVYPGNKANYKDMAGITTWSFWLMLELCEYVERTGDIDFALGYRERVKDFVKGSMTFIGSSGLLENMPHIFVDWSQSNSNTQPISVAANALYSFMLLQLGKLYDDKDYTETGAKIKDILRSALSNLGKYLPDSLTYNNGHLVSNGRITESNQYTSLWAELFLKDEMKELSFNVTHTMGPKPTYPANPNVGGAGLFIGLCIRLDLLSKWGEYRKLLEDIKEIFYMQLKEGPGTLWENSVIDTSSRCHGFTAHVGVHLTRDILGLGIPNEKDKIIVVSPHPCDLRWARGVVKTKGGIASLSWRIEGDKFILNCSVPNGYRVDIKISKELQCFEREINIEGEIL